MKLVGAGGQQVRHPLFDASGTIAAGGTAQLVLPQAQARSKLILGNNSAGPMFLEFGSARATATITNGVVTSVAITNGGFKFTKPPIVRFLGGGTINNSSYLGLGQPNGASPSNVATGRAILTGDAVSSIVVDNGGAGYVIAPYVFIENSDLDPYGCAKPALNVGILLPAQGAPLVFNGTALTTDAVAIFGASTGQAFVCKWMD